MPAKRPTESLTLDQLEARLAKIREQEAEIEAAKQKKLENERAGVIDRIIQGMRSYGITIPQLREALGAEGRSGPNRAPQRNSVGGRRPMSDEERKLASERMKKRRAQVMYRGPNDEVWSGLGQAPAWIKKADKQRGGRKRYLTEEFKEAA